MRLPSIPSQSCPRKRRLAAFTLIEISIGLGLGLLILATMSTTFVLLNRGMNALANYEQLDRQSRAALDTMSRDIRQTACMTNFTATSLTFTNQDGSLLAYNWDGSNYVTYTNGSTYAILLSNCISCKFDIYLHTPSNGTTMTFWPAYSNNCPLAKVVVVNWICRRTNYASLMDSESVQTAKIVLRN